MTTLRVFFIAELFFVVPFLCMLVGPQSGFAQSSTISGVLDAYVKKSALDQGDLGAVVLDAQSGNTLFEYRADSAMIPASVIKILTGYAALRVLGSNFSFSTKVFTDESSQDVASSGYAQKLYVRGYGDPSLVEESLWQVAQELHRRGLKRIERVVLDDSFFVEPSGRGGQRAYESGQGALSLNHNSLAIYVTGQSPGDPPFVSVSGENGYVVVNKAVSAKSSQGSLDVSLDSVNSAWSENGNELKGTLGTVRVSGKVASGETEVVYRAVSDPTAYFGTVFSDLLRQAGILVSKPVIRGQAPSRADLLYVHQSKPLTEILRDLNLYSNNFIAEQLVFALGQDSGASSSHEAGMRAINKFISNARLGNENFRVVDGSGLSRDNRATANGLAHILKIAGDDFSVGPYFLASLSRFGVSGTLKKRELGTHESQSGENGQRTFDVLSPRSESVWGKTGSLTDVSSLAGYALTGDGRKVIYVILINGKYSYPEAKKFEDGFINKLISFSK